MTAASTAGSATNTPGTTPHTDRTGHPATAPSAQTANTSAGASGQPDRTRRLLDWRLRFAVLALVWGCSFLFIKVGTEAYAPLQVTLGRMVFGAAVLGLVLVVRRERLPRPPRVWAHVAVAAFLLNSLPFTLFAYAELTIPSGVAGICNATMPLWAMLLSMSALSDERPTARRAAGLAVGFLGVLTVFGVWQGFRHNLDPAGMAMALGASFSYACGWLYVRRTLTGSGSSNLALSGTQMLLGTVQLAVVTPLFTSLPTDFAPLPLLSVAALGVLGTGVAFLLQYGLVAEVGPTTAQMTGYFVPIVATVAGVAVLGEPFTWNTPVGALIVVAGAALAQTAPGALRRRRRP